MKNTLYIIPEFPNYYITKDGQVWSKPRPRSMNKSGKWLRIHKHKNDYLYVCLCKKGKMYSKSIHRLLLEVFTDKCPEGMECRHLDGNRQNNKLSNLKWGTKSENMQDAVRHRTAPGFTNKGEGHGMAKLTALDIKRIILMYSTKNITQKKIADMYDVTPAHISNIINKKTWRHIRV